jgi:hypothetical protein
MTDEELDQAILQEASPRFLKTAMVLARVNQKYGFDYDLTFQRICQLVENRKLESIGDISRWRHSELRLPSVRPNLTVVWSETD